MGLMKPQGSGQIPQRSGLAAGHIRCEGDSITEPTQHGKTYRIQSTEVQNDERILLFPFRQSPYGLHRLPIQRSIRRRRTVVHRPHDFRKRRRGILGFHLPVDHGNSIGFIQTNWFMKVRCFIETLRCALPFRFDQERVSLCSAIERVSHSSRPSLRCSLGQWSCSAKSQCVRAAAFHLADERVDRYFSPKHVRPAGLRIAQL